MRWLATACASLAATPSTTVPLVLFMVALSVVERGEQLALRHGTDLRDVELVGIGHGQRVEDQVDRRAEPPRLVLGGPAGRAPVDVGLAGEQVVRPVAGAGVAVVEVVDHGVPG